LAQFQFHSQTSDAVLELAVLGGIDERVDTAVGERQCHRKVVDDSVKVDTARDHND